MVRAQLTNLHQQTGCTILMIEHRIREALPMATRLFGLKLGRMKEVGLSDKTNIEESITAILI
jgi:ABC-type nitrate/sulfonate/bicarbonate transport system ATPase subunit